MIKAQTEKPGVKTSIPTGVLEVSLSQPEPVEVRAARIVAKVKAVGSLSNIEPASEITKKTEAPLLEQAGIAQAALSQVSLKIQSDAVAAQSGSITVAAKSVKTPGKTPAQNVSAQQEIAFPAKDIQPQAGATVAGTEPAKAQIPASGKVSTPVTTHEAVGSLHAQAPTAVIPPAADDASGNAASTAAPFTAAGKLTSSDTARAHTAGHPGNAHTRAACRNKPGLHLCPSGDRCERSYSSSENR